MGIQSKLRELAQMTGSTITLHYDADMKQWLVVDLIWGGKHRQALYPTYEFREIARDREPKHALWMAKQEVMQTIYQRKR